MIMMMMIMMMMAHPIDQEALLYTVVKSVMAITITLSVTGDCYVSPTLPVCSRKIFDFL